MEELFLKVGEFGALGLITIYLLTKGTDALNKLAESNKSLAESVNLLAEKVNAHDSRFNVVEHQLRSIENQLADLKRFIEGTRERGNTGTSRFSNSQIPKFPD